MDIKNWSKVQQPEGFFSVSPLPTAEQLKDFYAEKYFQTSQSFSYQTNYSIQEIEYKKLYARMFLYALGCQDSEKTFLEVGCGEGFLLEEARVNGWSVSGLDYSDYGIRQFHPHLLPLVDTGDAIAILDGYISEQRQFDACVLQNVLEHVIDPRHVLQILRGLVTRGRLLVTLPNDNSLIQAKAIETGVVDHEFWFVPPQHLHYFDLETASALVRNCGYEVVDAFCDFPIESFLFHPGSNYVRNRNNGTAAHIARMTMSLLCAEKGIDRYMALSRAYAGCGIGRAFTLVLATSN